MARKRRKMTRNPMKELDCYILSCIFLSFFLSFLLTYLLTYSIPILSSMLPLTSFIRFFLFMMFLLETKCKYILAISRYPNIFSTLGIRAVIHIWSMQELDLYRLSSDVDSTLTRYFAMAGRRWFGRTYGLHKKEYPRDSLA